MSEFTGEVHPIADYFAMLPDDELQELADDIATNGLQHPIILDAKGRLLDGRNRLHACERAGVQPMFLVRADINGDEDSPAKIARLIRSNNNRRRNQSTGQQAATDALLLDAEGLRKDGRWEYGTNSQKSGSSKAEAEALRMAGFILDHHRALLVEVAQGVVPISVAYEQVKSEQEQAAQTAKITETLRERDPDLLRLVADESLTLEQAWAAHLKATEDEREAESQRKEARAKETLAFSRAIDQLAAFGEFPKSLDTFLVGYLPDDTLTRKHITPAQIQHAIDGLTSLLNSWKDTQ